MELDPVDLVVVSVAGASAVFIALQFCASRLCEVGEDIRVEMVEVAGAEFKELSHLTVSERCDETLEPPLLQSESKENSWDRKQLFRGSFPIVAVTLLLWLPVVD